MIDLKSLLNVKHFDSSTYTDYDFKLGNSNPDETVTLTLDTDHYLYIGYYKPIKYIYFDLPTPNENAATLTVEYYNGTDWTSIDSIVDETKGLTQNGFIQWEELEDQDNNEVD